MVSGLNFNRYTYNLILAFVSFLVMATSHAQTSGQAADEFDIFEEEIKGTSKSAPYRKTKPTNQAPSSAPFSTETRSPKKATTKPLGNPPLAHVAEEHFKKGEYDKVTKLLWPQVDKIDRKSLVLLAKAHEKRKEASEMIRALNILIGKDAKDFEAHALMGNAHLLEKKNKDAMESFKKALEFNARYEPAYDGLIRLYGERQPPNLYELRILYQDMIDAIGARPIYLRKLCEVNTQDNTFEAAIQTCKEAISKDSSVADPYVYLALSYAGMGEDKRAQSALKKAAKDFPKSELAQFQYAKTLEDQKNYVDAMRVYKLATEADAQSSRSWLGLANSSFEIRKYEIALAAYKLACKFDKKTAVSFRRATTVLRNTRNSEWLSRFESSSENCNL
ncbi:MAG: O-linked GlcNAc transferase [Bdellovibrio sp.]|nr:O-linked GlcNAc transferase [Bdellovibrio sp.]